MMATRGRGTRFRIYPQSPTLDAFRQPQTVWIDLPPGAVGPGPSDTRILVIDPVDKRCPFDGPLPPSYGGPLHLPVMPGPKGHFDHLEPGTRIFDAAHMYAVIRWVLEVWEGYIGRPVPWHFRQHHPRLILIPHVDWENAQSGYGFIEAGYDITARGERVPHCLNFDVLAHELGHSILYSLVGIPTSDTRTDEYFAFHEAAADLTALIACLHFESVVDTLLDTTAGNLYALNELNRIGERSEVEQIRVLSNVFRMAHFVRGWKTEHYLSLPLSGAIFDILVDVFQFELYRRGLIDRYLADLSLRVPDPLLDYQRLQADYARHYDRNPDGFKAALIEARDYIGHCLALSWQWLVPDALRFRDVWRAMLMADEQLSGGVYRASINLNFDWREIGRIEPGPRLPAPADTSVKGCRA